MINVVLLDFSLNFLGSSLWWLKDGERVNSKWEFGKIGKITEFSGGAVFLVAL